MKVLKLLADPNVILDESPMHVSHLKAPRPSPGQQIRSLQMLKIPSKSSKSDGNSNLKGMTGKPILFLAEGSNERFEAFGRPQCHPT